METLRVIGDLTIPEDVARVVRETIERFGHIDILVHNAGGNIRAGGAGGHPDPDDAIDISVEDVEAVLGSNLLSTILICKAVAAGAFFAARHRARAAIDTTIDLSSHATTRNWHVAHRDARAQVWQDRQHLFHCWPCH